MRRLLLHGGDPTCTQRPDWIIRREGAVWAAVDVSQAYPIRAPWWSPEGRWTPPERLTVHVLVAGAWLDGLPTGPAEVAGELCAQLMEGYDLGHPRAHYAQGRCTTPAGLGSTAPPPCVCPPWAWWGEVAEGARYAASQRIRAPMDARRRYLYDGLGGGG